MFFNQSMNQTIDNESYYKLLGVNKNASKSEIKKAYHKSAMKNHPDKGGDPEKFKEISKAFEILSDENKRKNYDQFGSTEDNGNNGMNPNDILSQMFSGGGGPMNSNNMNKKGKTLKKDIQVSLKDIFNGKTMNITITRKSIDTNNISSCVPCKGQGMISQTIQMGPMIQQIQSPCNVCGGQGKQFKVNNVSENIRVNVPRGSPNNHKIVIFDKGDDVLDGDPGDLHIIVKVLDNEYFIRKGNDLFINKDISLVEALNGFNMIIKHFDRDILMKSDNVIKPNNYDINSDNKYEWKSLMCSLSIEPFAKAKISDEQEIKKLIEVGELKNENINGFIIKDNETYFYKESIDILLKNKNNGNSVFYYKNISDNSVHCIEEEGLPDLNNPMLKGDLYITFNIIFPDKITIDNEELIKGGFDWPIHENIDEIETELEVYELIEKNPNISYEKYKECLKNEEEQESNEHPGMQQQQCSQQ